MVKTNHLPFVKVDATLSKLGVLENSTVQTSDLIKALFRHIKANNLYVKKV